jgi:NAD(P)-dependent dehydrogenase (short-subunit alcohol dehydrogenase family)
MKADTVSTNDRVALVSGAAGGIGRAYAQRLAADGFMVAAIDLAAPDETVEMITGDGGRAKAFVVDVTDPDAVDDGIATITAAVGAPSVLINNVGVYPVVKWQDLTLEEFRRVMAINLESVFLMCKACVPAMREAGWGRIVNIASRTYWLPTPDMAAYLASKGGVIGLTRALATELGGDGITANVIAPGLTRTASIEAITADAVFEMTKNMQSIKRTQQPSDLVGLVSFLASDDSAFMTGQTLMVDGGLIRL